MSREESSRQAISDAYTEFVVSRLGLPAAVGRIFAALLLSPVPLSQAQLRASLSLSDGSVSEGLRLLLRMGFVERSGELRKRPAYFQVRAGAWADSAYGTMDNANATYAMTLLLLKHFEDYGIDGPSFELVARTKAMYEVFVEELPALAQKAIAAGERAAASPGKSAQAG
jgi:hypothetical protein